ncbi:MAG: nucleotidyltransferase domain-containing protein [Nitrospirota bacterium]
MEILRQLHQFRLKRRAQKAARIIGQQPDVEQVILYGSVARGQADRGSDIDLAVVLSTSSLTGFFFGCLEIEKGVASQGFKLGHDAYGHIGIKFYRDGELESPRLVGDLGSAINSEGKVIYLKK